MRFLVWGLGKSGRAAAELLKKEGFTVYAGDDKEGETWRDVLGEVDTVVLSPGIPPFHPLWKEALRRDIEVIGELELATRFFRGTLLAVTGTDGKSTTTRLLYLMLKKEFPKVYEAGNIGTPFSEVVKRHRDGIAVLEVSSFQGKTLKRFRPHIGAFLNFHQDHLDWHPDLKDYLESKYKIFSNQNEEDFFITPSNQFETVNTPTRAKKILLWKDLRIAQGEVFFKNNSLFSVKDVKIQGEHNLLNAASAALAARLMGVSEENIRKTLREFKGLPFRLELVKVWKGIEIYNDSKATTPNALGAALQSFKDKSVILIAGGKDKGADFTPLKDLVRKKVKEAFFIGETAERLVKELKIGVKVDSLKEALKQAFDIAQEGDVILFSPGCSSFDMFTSYIERGKTFNRLVEELTKDGDIQAES